jgi:hypothetical protein
MLSPRVASLIERFGATRLIGLGLASTAAGYALFVPVGLNSGYAAAMLPTFVLAGLGFGLACGPLNVAATSFQFGVALVLAVVTAVNGANTGGSPAGLLNGFHAAIVVSLIAALLGVAAMALRRRTAAAACPETA